MATKLMALKTMTLDELRDARTLMMSTVWTLELEEESEEVRKEETKRKLQTQLAILTLENAKLKDIRDKLAANEDNLKKSTAALKKAKEDLDNIANVINALGDLLGVVGAIVADAALPGL